MHKLAARVVGLAFFVLYLRSNPLFMCVMTIHMLESLFAALDWANRIMCKTEVDDIFGICLF